MDILNPPDNAFSIVQMLQGGMSVESFETYDLAVEGLHRYEGEVSIIETIAKETK